MPDHPDTLAKYATGDDALTMLRTQALRWRAPALFSDPFELTHQTPLSFEPNTLLDRVIRAACGMIFAPEEPRGTSPLATVIRRWRDEERFASPEEAEEVLRELMARMVDQRLEDIDELMSLWRRYTRALRICSFSARADNLTAWQYFADCHRGAVLKFECGEGTCLPHPLPVQYHPQRPEITTLKEQLDAILYNESIKPQNEFQEKFLRKPPQAKNEQEWRCFLSAEGEASSKEADWSQWYDDRAFQTEHLRAVYLGAFMPVQIKKQIVASVREHYPDTRLFQGEAVPGKYEITFTRLRASAG